jgi:hypothetical protein
LGLVIASESTNIWNRSATSNGESSGPKRPRAKIRCPIAIVPSAFRHPTPIMPV